MRHLSALSLLIVTALPGCGLLSESVTEAAHNVGQGVTFYCNNTDIYVREQFATLVNEGAAPNSIAVNCVNGYRLEPLPLTAPAAPVTPTPE